MVIKLLGWWGDRSPEHPDKIERLRHKLTGLRWSSSERQESIRAVFLEVDMLAELERRRRTRSWVSGVTRIMGWVCGAAGLLLPLIGAADPSRGDLAKWGYVALAAAGSLFGANSLFGGTSGHTSFVLAQLAIERLITETRIAWTKMLAEMELHGKCADQLGPEQLTSMFELIQNYATAVYDITASETAEWRTNILGELAKAAGALNSKPVEPGRGVSARRLPPLRDDRVG